MKQWGFFVCAICFFSYSWSVESRANQAHAIQVGAEQIEAYLPLLKGKRVGLVANQTSVAFEINIEVDADDGSSDGVSKHRTRTQDKNIHLLDLLLKNNINVTHVFAPEHGVRGDHSDGEIVKSSVDAKTGIPLVSIYGKNKRPPNQIIAELDVIVYDIQDVGARFYTYINSMFYMMQAAQQQGIPFIVLDRPNPHLQKVDGPMLDPKFRSFVGLLPVPMVYGLTVGELAQMIVGENWLNSIYPIANQTASIPLELTVIPVKYYQRTENYNLPIPPSPNLPNTQAVTLYPSLVLFEATTVSIGRGTQQPFQVIGHPELFIGNYSFTPRSIAGVSKYPKWENTTLTGTLLLSENGRDDGLINSQLDLSFLYQWHQLFMQTANTSNAQSRPKYIFIDRPEFFDKLAGTDQLRKDLQDNKALSDIRNQWQPGLNQFLKDRQPYLIYQ